MSMLQGAGDAVLCAPGPIRPGGSPEPSPLTADGHGGPVGTRHAVPDFLHGGAGRYCRAYAGGVAILRVGVRVGRCRPFLLRASARPDPESQNRMPSLPSQARDPHLFTESLQVSRLEAIYRMC